jgi:uncharacterized protein YigA (DUF484 family)
VDDTSNDDERGLEELVQLIQANPGVFVSHPQLLECVDIPHGAGATSLIEHQVRVLRERNAQITGQLESLLKIARDNERVSQRIHAFALGMLGADTAGDMLGLVYATAHEHFGAERCAVRLYRQAPSGERGCGEFLGRAGESTQALDACMDACRPVCGNVDARTASLLFGDFADSVRSVALIPTVGAELRGVLGVASSDSDHFSVNSGTLFLEQLGDLLTHSLLRVIR